MHALVGFLPAPSDTVLTTAPVLASMTVTESPDEFTANA
jgi:hypothetical protein